VIYHSHFVLHSLNLKFIVFVLYPDFAVNGKLPFCNKPFFNLALRVPLTGFFVESSMSL